jgi:paraquat-inducible protein B
MNDPHPGPGAESPVDTAKPYDTPPPLAQARGGRRRFPVVWVAPLAAALVSGYLLFEQFHDLGPMITLRFQDGSGLKAGQTDIQYRGVPVGQVKTVELSKDGRQVEARARLRRSAASLAREGSLFWVVRLKGGIENMASLGTVISGPYIEVRPGTGQAREDFVGQDRPPVATGEAGLGIVLRASRLGSLRPNSPVYYRGIEVGAVQESRLSTDAGEVEILVAIEPRYAKLVRQGSRFWSVSGVKVDFGLFKGLSIDMQSLRSLATGGVAFATPGGRGPARNGAAFRLYERANPAWLAWTPRIMVDPDASRSGSE